MKNHQTSSEPVWPYIGVVSCLFVLSVFAARSWQTDVERPKSAIGIEREPAEPADFGADAWIEPSGGFASRTFAPPVLRNCDLVSPEIDSQWEQLADVAEVQADDSLPAGRTIPARGNGEHAAVAELPEPQLVQRPADRGPSLAGPVVDSRRSREPAVELLLSEPALSEPALAEPTLPEPALSEATLPEPALSEPVVSEPVVSNPAFRSASPSVEQLAERTATGPQTVDLAPPVAERIRLVPADEEPAVERVEEREAPRHFPQPAEVARQQPTHVVRESLSDAAPRELRVAEILYESDWPRAAAAEALLNNLSSVPHCGGWADRAREAFERIRRLDDLSSTLADDVLMQLQLLSKEGSRLAESASSVELRSELLRASYAIDRRRTLWEQVHRITANPNHGLVSVGLHDLETAIDSIDRHLGGSAVADGWRNYLLLSELRAANQHGDSLTQRQLARRSLERLSGNETMSAEQLAYLKRAPFPELVQGLGRWAQEPIDYTQVLKNVEKYELRGESAVAAELARVCRIARWSNQQDVKQLAEKLETHYRNANLRVAVNVDLINRLLPQPTTVSEDVDEYILGAYVNGSSQTSSKLKVVLAPDERLWRVQLEAQGKVASQTAANKGPATFYNEGHSEFTARKTLLVDNRGVKVELAEAEADTESELTGFETQFDPVPVVGLLARAIARQQHDGRYGDAQAAAEARLEERARQRLDEEVHRRLDEIEEDFRDRILDPFTALDLRPKAINMRTTSDRLVIRYRLAGDDQLGAHTPRPQAPSDSLLSVQLHESMLNNIIDQLELEGSEGDLPALYSRIAGRFKRDVEIPADMPEGVRIRFAPRSALRLRFEDGRATLTAYIAELSNHRRAWHNFAVRVHYVPDPLQQDANLIRDGVVELISRRLGLGDQIVLRGIFSKVFSRNSPFNVINRRLAAHPQMNDLQVTQCAIADGWIGVALGPQRAVTPPLARQEAASRHR